MTSVLQQPVLTISEVTPEVKEGTWGSGLTYMPLQEDRPWRLVPWTTQKTPKPTGATPQQEVSGCGYLMLPYHCLKEVKHGNRK